mgnify:CR=1 FL=1|tara:strand:+ start:1244 stop:1549 length:306 start_codon:yes stop_codon:yes gene_type:complete
MNFDRPTYITAIKQLVSGNIGGLNDGPIEKIKFFDGQTPPSESEIQAKLAELQADYESKQYQRDRAAAYPSWQDQLDNIFHNGINAWKADIQAIKDQFPKP